MFVLALQVPPNTLAAGLVRFAMLVQPTNWILHVIETALCRTVMKQQVAG